MELLSVLKLVLQLLLSVLLKQNLGFLILMLLDEFVKLFVLIPITYLLLKSLSILQLLQFLLFFDALFLCQCLLIHQLSCLLLLLFL